MMDNNPTSSLTGLIDKRKERSTDRKMYTGVDEQTDKWTDTTKYEEIRQTDRQVNRQTDGRADR